MSIRALGGTLVEEQDGILWVTFISRIFHFVEGMEFRLVAEEGVDPAALSFACWPIGSGDQL